MAATSSLVQFNRGDVAATASCKTRLAHSGSVGALSCAWLTGTDSELGVSGWMLVAAAADDSCLRMLEVQGLAKAVLKIGAGPRTRAAPGRRRTRRAAMAVRSSQGLFKEVNAETKK